MEGIFTPQQRCCRLVCRIIGFISFTRVSAKFIRETVLAWIWTRIAVSNSYDSNHNTTNASVKLNYLVDARCLIIIVIENGHRDSSSNLAFHIALIPLGRVWILRSFIFIFLYEYEIYMTAIEEKWNKMSKGYILKARKSFWRHVDTIIEKIVAILSKFTVLCLSSYFVVYIFELILFYGRVVYHYTRIFLILLLLPVDMNRLG